MKVLITGAGGFIGRHLVADQLQRDRQVTAIDLKVEALKPLSGDPRLQIVESDFSNHSQLDPLLAGHDVCIHLASAHLETGLDSRYFWQVNVDRTLEFVKLCYEAKIPRFVHCSTVGVYGNIKNPPADENSDSHPDVAYEQSKLAGERAVREFAQESGYAVVVIRPAWVYGPGCPRTERLFKTIKKGRFFYVGNGEALRHPIFVDDMVQGFEVATTNENAVGELFIMAGPRAVTVRELAENIANTLSVSPPKLKVPIALVWPVVLGLEVVGRTLKRDAPFTRRSLKFFTGNTSFTTNKAKELLDYQATIELPEGLHKTYQWLVEANRI